jgi:hypothetical protein
MKLLLRTQTPPNMPLRTCGTHFPDFIPAALPLWKADYELMKHNEVDPLFSNCESAYSVKFSKFSSVIIKMVSSVD